MPGLRHNPEYERHMTLADLAHCPRHGWYDREMRAGRMAETPPSTSLVVGILAHVGLAALWKQRADGHAVWTPSLALDAMDAAPEAADVFLASLKDGPAACDSLRGALVEYAAQWTGARDHWRPLAVAPEDVPPLPWTVLASGRFVAYPDLIVAAPPLYPVLVVDHKTSAYKFDPRKWEWHPELLTQCLAARQLVPDTPIHYTIDMLQRPGYRSTVWSFPATPVWEFTEEKAEAARDWLMEAFWRIDEYSCSDGPWPRELSACVTPYGMCAYYDRCFGEKED